MAEMMFELTIADKKHDPLATNAKHMVGNNFHVGNVRLIKGQWTRVNEWWFIKNQALVKKYMDQGQILVKAPDGSIMGQGAPAAAMIVETPPVMPVFEEPVVAAPEPTPEPLPVVEDDFSILPLKAQKVERLKEVAKTFAGVVELDVAGLVEQVHLTPAQAEKVLEFVKAKLAR